MEMADRFGIPVISLVDTAGAYPGTRREERGQAEAIARSTDAVLAAWRGNIAVIIGEGGSGGGDCDRNRQSSVRCWKEHAIYSVISARGGIVDPVARRTKAQGGSDQHGRSRLRICYALALSTAS